MADLVVICSIFIVVAVCAVGIALNTAMHERTERILEEIRGKER
jgi:hypothetical protein